MPASPRARALLAGVAAAAAASACASAGAPTAGHRASRADHRPSTTVLATTLPQPPPSMAPPSMATTTAAPAAAPVGSTGPPAFASSVSTLTGADLASSWRPGCPVGPDGLRLLHLSYWGFDGQPHVGSIVVATGLTADVMNAFAALYAERFPIRQMVPLDAYGGNDNAAAAADDTSGFNCRYAVAPGPPQWSAHAFGEAIDVNDVENPYVDGATIIPPAGARYLNRTVYRPGMAVTGGQLVAAFAAVGWSWGGRWTGSPDYQHFSKTGG